MRSVQAEALGRNLRMLQSRVHESEITGLISDDAGSSVDACLFREGSAGAETNERAAAVV